MWKGCGSGGLKGPTETSFHIHVYSVAYVRPPGALSPTRMELAGVYPSDRDPVGSSDPCPESKQKACPAKAFSLTVP